MTRIPEYDAIVNNDYSTSQNIAMHNLDCSNMGEVWSFFWAKEKNLSPEHHGQFGYGDVWTWTANDAQTKLVPWCFIGNLTAADVYAFIPDLAGRLANRVHLTTDGLNASLQAADAAFGGEIDYAMLVKVFDSDPENETSYSPVLCIGIGTNVVTGNLDAAIISTSHVEQQTLTMRMGVRRCPSCTTTLDVSIRRSALHRLSPLVWPITYGRSKRSRPYSRSTDGSCEVVARTKMALRAS